MISPVRTSLHHGDQQHLHHHRDRGGPQDQRQGLQHHLLHLLQRGVGGEAARHHAAVGSRDGARQQLRQSTILKLYRCFLYFIFSFSKKSIIAFYCWFES